MAVANSAQDIVKKMKEDLEQALEKSEKDRSWAMLIDIRKCIGCKACTAACIVENATPPNVTYRTVVEREATLSNRPHVQPIPMPTNCMQCAKPPCVKAANRVAPGSFVKRPDGIVAINYTKMKRGRKLLGQRVFKAARKACPYTYALFFDDGKYHVNPPDGPEVWEGRTTYEYNKLWSRDQIVGSPRKCHFCLHRLTIGELPACVTTCVGKAMMFGDINDPDSYVSGVLKDEADKVLRITRKGKDTQPRIYYLSETPQECKNPSCGGHS